MNRAREPEGTTVLESSTESSTRPCFRSCSDVKPAAEIVAAWTAARDHQGTAKPTGVRAQRIEYAEVEPINQSAR